MLYQVFRKILYLTCFALGNVSPYIPPCHLSYTIGEQDKQTDCTKINKAIYLFNFCPSPSVSQKDELLLLNLEGDVFSSLEQVQILDLLHVLCIFVD